MKKFYEVKSRYWNEYNYDNEGYFTTYEEAEKYIIKRGGKITDELNCYKSSHISFFIKEHDFIA